MLYECHADRMRRAVLLGVPGSKRTEYLKRAAEQGGLSLYVLDWKNWQEKMAYFAQDKILMKIDPPLWDSCALGELARLSEDYKKQLRELAGMAHTYDVQFLNHPSAIADLLDKAECKKMLRRAGLPVTEVLAYTLPRGRTMKTAKRPLTDDAAECSAEQNAGNSLIGASAGCSLVENAGCLLEIMKSRGVWQIFIKPLHGSGAAGVSAFRMQRSSGRMALYTCAMEHPEKGLVNTNRLWYFSDADNIFSLLDQILQVGCVIERWHAKSGYQGYSYDLRAVVQNGRLDYLLARLSRGPITNLHLNNRPLSISALELPSAVLDMVADISLKAVELYPGLSCAGIDILLEKGSLRPRIIEMNGQGDLIYQDIYQENRIYRRQAELMKEMAGER